MYGHPIGIVIERVALATIRIASRQHKKPLLRGEIDITFLPHRDLLESEFLDFFDLEEVVLVEGTLVNTEADALVAKVDVMSKEDSSRLLYTARVTFYSSPDPAWSGEGVLKKQSHK